MRPCWVTQSANALRQAREIKVSRCKIEQVTNSGRNRRSLRRELVNPPRRAIPGRYCRHRCYRCSRNMILVLDLAAVGCGVLIFACLQFGRQAYTWFLSPIRHCIVKDRGLTEANVGEVTEARMVNRVYQLKKTGSCCLHSLHSQNTGFCYFPDTMLGHFRAWLPQL
jgi:hypothetical protein